MSYPELIDCVDFRLKFESFKTESLACDDPNLRFETYDSIGEYVGVAKSTVSAWINGRGDTGRAAGMLRDRDIRKLAVAYSGIAKGRVSVEEAHNLWKKSSFRLFDRRLSQTPDFAFHDVLEQKKPSLIIDIISEPKHLGLIEEVAEPDAGERVFHLGERFCIQVQTRKEKSLIVLGTSRSGCTLMAPSRWHNGRVGFDIECLPDSDYWTFGEDGPARIYVLELPAETPPIERRRGHPVKLTDHQERILIEELLDSDRANNWRWGVLYLFVKKTLVNSVGIESTL